MVSKKIVLAGAAATALIIGAVALTARGYVPPPPPPPPGGATVTLAVDSGQVSVLQVSTFSGTVKDSNGRPAPSVKVNLLNQGGSTIQGTGATNASGAFSITHSWSTLGTYMFFAQAVDSHNLPVGASAPVTVTVFAPQPLTGQQSFGQVIVAGPAGSIFVDIGVSVNGGSSPFTFSMLWSDGVPQGPQIDNAVFSRTFVGAPTSTSGTVTVKDNAGLIITIPVKAPYP